MPRPNKKYVIINWGKAEPVIYDGRADAALRVAHLKGLFGQDYSACHLSFRNTLDAEEFISWWQYERQPNTTG